MLTGSLGAVCQTAMFMIDESGRLQRINQAATTLTQYSQEEVRRLASRTIGP